MPTALTPSFEANTLRQKNQGGLCMKGGIFSDQRCPVCSGRFRDDKKRGLFCPHHPEQQATRFRVYFKGVTRRFASYEDAQRFLTGVRFKTDEGKFDEREYKKANPLGFTNLAEQWLETKRATVKKGSIKNLRNYMARAMKEWGQTNVKDIAFPEFEDFLLGQRLELSGQAVSAKTRANMRSCLHSFWSWLRRRRVLAASEMPDFPEAPFELGLRKTLDKAAQEAVIDEVKALTWDKNPRIWMGIKWLATYISIRPGELLMAKEGDFDLEQGYLIIPHPKEKRPKLIPLVPEDVEAIRSLPRGLPHIPFFRHSRGLKGCREGQPFGGNYLYKWWKKACTNLGIQSIDLYGGTRHSSAMALREFRTPEEIRRATMHSTNKAFERYFRMEGDDLRAIYSQSRPLEGGKALAKKKSASEKAKILKLQ
jgi:integrase